VEDGVEKTASRRSQGKAAIRAAFKDPFPASGPRQASLPRHRHPTTPAPLRQYARSVGRLRIPGRGCARRQRGPALEISSHPRHKCGVLRIILGPGLRHPLPPLSHWRNVRHRQSYFILFLIVIVIQEKTRNAAARLAQWIHRHKVKSSTRPTSFCTKGSPAHAGRSPYGGLGKCGSRFLFGNNSPPPAADSRMRTVGPSARRGAAR